MPPISESIINATAFAAGDSYPGLQSVPVGYQAVLDYTHTSGFRARLYNHTQNGDYIVAMTGTETHDAIRAVWRVRKRRKPDFRPCSHSQKG